MHEDIVTRIAGNESKAFRGVEPLHSAGIAHAGLQRRALAWPVFSGAAGQACGQVQNDGEACADQCRQVAHFGAGQQGQGLQDHGHHQQGAGQVLQLLAGAAVVQRHDRCQQQVEQAEQGQVDRLRLLQEGCCVVFQAGYER
ncbi:hypothetical protein D3C79_871000 [compost metagenome]